MPVDLDDQLAALGAELMRDSAPITLAELAAGDVVAVAPAPNRRRWAAVAAIATAAASLAALVVIVDRDGDGGPSTLPAPEAVFVEGVLDVDPTSAVADGWEVQAEADVLDGGWGEIVTRRYAIDSPQPETGPALDVATFMDGFHLPNLPEGEPAVQIAGADAWWMETPGPGRGLAFLVAGRWFVVRGYRITDDQIVTAAEHVRLSADGVGAIVEDGGRPAGIVEQFVSGGMSEIWLFPVGLTGDEVKQVRWADGDRAVWLQAVPADDADAYAVSARTAASSVVEAAVGPHPSYVASSGGLPDNRWMAWTQDGWSYLLAGYLVSSDELVAFANALTPMPVERWTELVNASRRGDEIPVGVVQFPAVPDAATIAGGQRGVYGVFDGPAGERAYPFVHLEPAFTEVTVLPKPLVDVTADWEETRISDIGGRSAAAGTTGAWRHVAVDLGGGETLVVESEERSVEALLALAAVVDLVDQATWEDRYEPIRPVEAEEGADTTVPATTVAEALSGPVETLRIGDTGDRVSAVQEQLTGLRFDPGPVDGVFGEATEQAVWAFEKLVMGVSREQATGTVTPEVWRRMQEPVIVMPRRSQGEGVDHAEIYLPEQVLVVFHSDQPVLITHISTGALDESGDPAAWCETLTVDTDAAGMALPEPDEMTICGRSKTPGGIFEADRVVAGIRLRPVGAMFDPIYFNRGIAIHGGLEVPLRPATKGSVRVPMHISEYLHDLIPVGTTIFVWDGVKEPEEQTPADEMPVFDSVQPGTAVP